MTTQKQKTKYLSNLALDWAVAKCEGWIDDCNGWLYQATLQEVAEGTYKPSTNWAQGGAIIERELITLDVATTDYDEEKDAVVRLPTPIWYAAMDTGDDEEIMMRGATPLIAAMRCYVCSVLGDEVDVPEGLQ